MQGYWQKPEANAAAFTADGYFRTGDIGVFDEKGFLRIVDRKKDMIIVSGFNVYPNEVEVVAAACAGVAECACVGRRTKDRRGGPPIGSQGLRRDTDRAGRHRALPAAARRLQGPQGGALPQCFAEIQCRQNPAQNMRARP